MPILKILRIYVKHGVFNKSIDINIQEMGELHLEELTNDVSF